MSSANASTSAGSWVMSRIGKREARLQLAQLGAQAVAQRLVERGERLVEQQRARLGGERARERDALALAARELVGIARRERAQLERVEPAVDRRAAAVAARVAPAAAEAEGDVLAHRQVREQRVLLEQVAAVALAAPATSTPAPASNSVVAADARCGRRRAAAGRRSPSASASCRRPTGRTGPAASTSLRNATSSSKRCAAGADRLARSRRPTARHERPGIRAGASRPASSSTAMQVTEVSSTSRLARSSWPACTAS